MPTVRTASRWVLGLLLVALGVNHFVNPDLYVRIMPPYLPWHRELVLLSGACEIACGLGLLIPPLTVAAAWGTIALLVAVFPANVHMALNPEGYADIARPWVWWARLPLQFVLIWWAYQYTRRGPHADRPQADAGRPAGREEPSAA